MIHFLSKTFIFFLVIFLVLSRMSWAGGNASKMRTDDVSYAKDTVFVRNCVAGNLERVKKYCNGDGKKNINNYFSDYDFIEGNMSNLCSWGIKKPIFLECTSLCFASYHGKIDIVKYLLTHKNILVSAPSFAYYVQCISENSSPHTDVSHQWNNLLKQEVIITPLVVAAYGGHGDIVKQLLKTHQCAQAEINLACCNAAREGHIAVLYMLHQQHRDINVRVPNVYWEGIGFTALSCAWDNGQIQAALLLFAQGADPNVDSDHEYSHKTQASCQIKDLLIAAVSNPSFHKLEILDLLFYSFKQACRLSFYTLDQEMSDICCIAIEKDFPNILEKISTNCHDMNEMTHQLEKEKESRTLLDIAQYHGRIEIMLWLLKQGVVKFTMTALREAKQKVSSDLYDDELLAACRGNHLLVVHNAIVHQGKNVNSGYGHKSIKRFLYCKDSAEFLDIRVSPLYAAACNGANQVVEYLLECHADSIDLHQGMQVLELNNQSLLNEDQKSRLSVQRTPLWAAAHFGHKRTVQLLAEAGCYNKEDWNYALIEAVKMGHDNIVCFLWQDCRFFEVEETERRFAACNHPFSGKKCTALVVALCCQKWSIARFLLEQDIDMLSVSCWPTQALCNELMTTPLHFAVQQLCEHELCKKSTDCCFVSQLIKRYVQRSFSIY